MSGKSYATTEMAFTNDISEEYFYLYEDMGYQWPLCGYPTHYSLVGENGDELDFECSVEADMTLDVTGTYLSTG